MSTMLVACKMIEDELNGALKRLGLDFPVIWVEAGLHDSPVRLRERMAEIMQEAEGQCQRLIFTLGYCGGGMSELRTGSFTTIVPLADDCLSLLLGSIKKRQAVSRPVTLFLTDGWMRQANNLLAAHERNVKRYGAERAHRVSKMVYSGYKRFGLVDTGCYDLDSAAAQIRPFAELMDMSVETLPGDNSWLDRLLLGPHDDSDKFLIIEPHSELGFEQWSKLMEGNFS